MMTHFYKPAGFIAVALCALTLTTPGNAALLGKDSAAPALSTAGTTYTYKGTCKKHPSNPHEYYCENNGSYDHCENITSITHSPTCTASNVGKECTITMVCAD